MMGEREKMGMAPAPLGHCECDVVKRAIVHAFCQRDSALTGEESSLESRKLVAVSAGTTVSFLNSDKTTHTSTADGGLWSSSSIAPGKRFNVTLSTAGRFAYHCTIHPNMAGTITVQ